MHFQLLVLMVQMQRGQMEQMYPLHGDLIDYSSRYEKSPRLGRDDYLAVDLQHGNSSRLGDHQREAPADSQCPGTREHLL